ncbi:MAG: hypothetical protein M1814_002590 [Vezdaea aestivalis]|nr:MAG: hypothetical protein M1814_002590 [Vezdaea aestivalis]
MLNFLANPSRLLRKMSPSQPDSEKAAPSTSCQGASSTSEPLRRTPSTSLKSLFRRASSRRHSRASEKATYRPKSPSPPRKSVSASIASKVPPTTSSSTQKRTAYVPRYAAAGHMATTGQNHSTERKSASSHAGRLSAALAAVELKQRTSQAEDDDTSNAKTAIGHLSKPEPLASTQVEQAELEPIVETLAQSALAEESTSSAQTSTQQQPHSMASIPALQPALFPAKHTPGAESLLTLDHRQAGRKIVHRTRDSGVADLESAAATPSATVATDTSPMAAKPFGRSPLLEEDNAEEASAAFAGGQKQKNPFRDSALGEEDLGIPRAGAITSGPEVVVE